MGEAEAEAVWNNVASAGEAGAARSNGASAGEAGAARSNGETAGRPFYLRPELEEILPAMPPQTTWDVASLRAADESFLAELPEPPAGVAAQWIEAGQPGVHGGTVRIREVRVRQPKRAVVFLHGGGYISGSAAFEDLVAGELALALDAAVFVPEYRLAPEHPYPAGLNDCLVAVAHAAATGMPVTLAGDSAGAGLALSAACRVCGWGPSFDGREKASVALDSLVLLEPCADPRQGTASFATYAEGPVWTAGASRFAWKQYLGATPADELLPERMIDAATEASEASSRFPATFVAANFADPLRDEAIAIATRLADRGVRTELRIPAGTFHAGLAASGTGVWAELRGAIAGFVGGDGRG